MIDLEKKIISKARQVIPKLLEEYKNYDFEGSNLLIPFHTHQGVAVLVFSKEKGQFTHIEYELQVSEIQTITKEISL